MPDVDLTFENSSTFVRASGFHLDETSGKRVTGHAELGPGHHTPWGVVHGGVFATIIESAASIGASAAVHDQGMYAVGTTNTTDFLRPVRAGIVSVVAVPTYQGRTRQVWDVVISSTATGKELARGTVRLQNVEFPN